MTNQEAVNQIQHILAELEADNDCIVDDIEIESIDMSTYEKNRSLQTNYYPNIDSA